MDTDLTPQQVQRIDWVRNEMVRKVTSGLERAHEAGYTRAVRHEMAYETMAGTLEYQARLAGIRDVHLPKLIFSNN